MTGSCWSRNCRGPAVGPIARRKFVDNEKAAPQVARVILTLINLLFDLEKRLKDTDADERLRRRHAEAMPLLDTLHALLVEQKAKLLPKHPLAEAIGYTLNQWRELTLFTTDPAVPIHNNLAEQQMKRIALLRKNALFAGSPRGGETARDPQQPDEHLPAARDQPADVSHAAPGEPARHADQPPRRLAARSLEGNGDAVPRLTPRASLTLTPSLAPAASRPPSRGGAIHSADTERQLSWMLVTRPMLTGAPSTCIVAVAMGASGRWPAAGSFGMVARVQRRSRM